MGWRDTTLTIALNETESEELDLAEHGARRNKILQFWAPATLTGAVTVHLAKAIGGTYGPLGDGYGTTYTVTAGQVQVLRVGNAGALKLVSAAAEGAAREFGIQGAVEGAIGR